MTLPSLLLSFFVKPIRSDAKVPLGYKRDSLGVKVNPGTLSALSCLYFLTFKFEPSCPNWTCFKLFLRPLLINFSYVLALPPMTLAIFSLTALSWPFLTYIGLPLEDF